MSNILFLKRIFSNKIYWLSVVAALLLLLCSIVYTDGSTGEQYMFLTLFYDETAQNALRFGDISMSQLMLGPDTSYLWMFCPIIVGIPCILTGKTERFVMFRTGKNKYVFSKYLSGLLASGMIPTIAYLLFAHIGMMITQENLWYMNLAGKLVSIFVWGIYCAIPSMILSEVVENKYLILCIPFVINYFMCMLSGYILPGEIQTLVSPETYQRLFLYDTEKIAICSAILLILVVACAVMKKLMLERRCDCGQK